MIKRLIPYIVILIILSGCSKLEESKEEKDRKRLKDAQSKRNSWMKLSEDMKKEKRSKKSLVLRCF